MSRRGGMGWHAPRDSRIFEAHNQFLTNQRLNEASAREQLSRAPMPHDRDAHDRPYGGVNGHGASYNQGYEAFAPTREGYAGTGQYRGQGGLGGPYGYGPPSGIGGLSGTNPYGDDGAVYSQGNGSHDSLRSNDSRGSLRSNGSSTTSLYEYPVLQDFNGKHYYDYQSKGPKEPTGPFRAVTNQNMRYKGMMCHNGFNKNPSLGEFHLIRNRDGNL
ncbi:hypothetical protein EJ08DRAFT_665105 [Tothia fuscella]|uniref:Uncharacterized protein n=1 Tax=Tothia fuscella TaxID=1048955 RepID=A0A9P4NH71_9PEZI|nr:hypothetical protein EJ08DRAFT_665105 [Tothia fuscella]